MKHGQLIDIVEIKTIKNSLSQPQPCGFCPLIFRPGNWPLWGFRAISGGNLPAVGGRFCIWRFSWQISTKTCNIMIIMGTFIRFSIPKPRCRSIFGQRWRIYYIPQPPRYSHIHGEYDEDSNIQQQSSNLPSPVAGSMLEGIFLGKPVTSSRPHWIWWLIRGHIPRYPIIIHSSLISGSWIMILMYKYPGKPAAEVSQK